MFSILWRKAARTTAIAGLGVYRCVQSKLRRPRVFVYYRDILFDRKARAYVDLFRRHGFDAHLRTGASWKIKALLKSSPDLWIGFWNGTSLGGLPGKYVVMNAEPINIKSARHDVELVLNVMRGAREVWGYTPSNSVDVNRLGVPFQYVPFGYAPYYEEVFKKHVTGKTLAKDIDVLFFGALSDRRRRMLDELKQRGMNVFIVCEQNATYGEHLDELLARTKVVLGIHYYEEAQAQIADFARVDHLLSNRIFVIHEKPSALAPALDFQRHVTTCDYLDIPDTCSRYLKDDEGRMRKATAAYEWFKAEMALDSFIPYGRVRELLGHD